ncbi:ATP-dependent zinc protease [Nitrosomonas sp. Is37]|uniref:ATP-dependent zinc protease family protein n=1 Tax=Nitrosomonas sp. Is37 TaxID=3080535 RepID=UPI00294B379E|nr:RimK/LysX family protein [Nitrosomonas sp. Is37]MDV6344404.1 RimK/LysX family protein [Nitrosomonas sp. Is37]
MIKILQGQFYCFLAIVLLVASDSVLSDNKTDQPELRDNKTDQPELRHILGWVESIRLEPWGLKMLARIDTGANTSSMSARDIHQFNKGNKDWVRFTLDFGTEKGKPNRTIEIERPILRSHKIKQHSGIPQVRLVVAMDICLANEVRNVEFNLIDRRALNYPILLGRRALAGVALVDSSRTHLSKADCGHVKKKKKKHDQPDELTIPE